MFNNFYPKIMPFVR